MYVDYLVVGSGLTGSVIARSLADAGREVLVLERRAHLGGNVFDEVHPCGIRFHTYGPHYFRTSSEEIWNFVNRFAAFYRFDATVQSFVDNSYENWPVAESYIKRTVGDDWQPSFRGIPRNFEEASLAMMPELVYRKFVKGYTEKQWGVAANTLSVDLASRFDVRVDGNNRLSRHQYQGIPEQGYAFLMREMLANIPIILNFDYLQNRSLIRARKRLVFTGPIDEFFNFDLGRLKYRGQTRIHRYLPDIDSYYQPCGQVNNPDTTGGSHIRTLEWKHMLPEETAKRIRGTVITREIPETPADPNRYEYPFPDNENAVLYQKYRERADRLTETTICGRLGEYRYYDMDQAIARAMLLARRLIASEESDIGTNPRPLLQP